MWHPFFLVAAIPALALAASQPVAFNRDIRPILSDKCFACHGPDAPKQKIRLRLDSEAAANADLGGGKRAVVPGKTSDSEMIRRITHPNKAMRMPPAHAAVQLTTAEIATLTAWIEQGAKWEKHWSFIAPEKPDVPVGANAIDYFVQQRLEREDLKPSSPAERITLIRRASLDITGLPPTPAEVDAFVQDTSPKAYERVLDRLLASPRYGERMAARWLDGARYADTNGYQGDGERNMWRWREWVIQAFNVNKPFDRFIVEQIAGDLLPNATLDQRIATGFNRNHRTNGEGGIIPAEYAVEYVVDRVETTSTMFLGLTLGCARCHNHKYDPFTQKEFYQLFAYFNQVPERGRGNKYGNSPPLVKAPTPEQARTLEELKRRTASAQQAFDELKPAIHSGLSEWRPEIEQWAPTFGLDAHVTTGSRVQGAKPALPLDAGDKGRFGYYSKFTISAWVNPADLNAGPVVSRMKIDPDGSGWGLYIVGGKVQLNLIQRWLDDCLRTETEEPIPIQQWTHVVATYDGTRVADGIRMFVNGQPRKLKVILDELNQSFETKEYLRVGVGAGEFREYRGLADDVRVYRGVLGRDEIAALADPTPLNKLHPADPKLRLAFLNQYGPENVRKAWKRLGDAQRTLKAFDESLPTVMVMQDMAKPRDTFLLARGQYDKPAEKVTPGVPASLPPLPEGAPNNRLGLARWLVDKSNPLVARVIVNRYWQMLFGTGLVKTVEDFGAQGEWPSHPALLDWLAVRFMESGWDTKALIKEILLSATYRQTSDASPELLKRDPENRLLARGPRLRLPAEVVRDQALFVAGLLVEKIGGPSVKPYQPAGLWKELAGADYKNDHGDSLYRRSLYTYWKRTSPPPVMMTFDAAGRETCIVRETRTNTPLQALNLMNDVTYVEASRAMAQRMVLEGGSDNGARLRFGFRLATARLPSDRELDVLARSLKFHLSRFDKDRTAAKQLIAVGESEPNPTVDAVELAAYTAVASMILNLDEVITRE